MRIVDASEMVLSSIALSHSGKVMFVGTIAGTVQSMKFPPTVHGKWMKFQGHGCPITKVCGSRYHVVHCVQIKMNKTTIQFPNSMLTKPSQLARVALNCALFIS